MAERYFLDKNGAVTRGQSGEGHHGIGSRILSIQGIVARDYEDVYRKMFRLEFARVVEHDDGITVEVEYGPELTAPQERFIAPFRKSGKKVVQYRAKAN